MGVGTSLGAYFDDSFHQATAQWDNKYDTNEVGVDQDSPAMNDKNNILPDDAVNYKFFNPQIETIANITNTPGEIMDGLEGTKQYPSGFSSPEKIKSAALIHNGETYEDMNHGMALGRIMDKYPDVNMKSIKDGFTTNRGRFVSREEAFDIANSNKQIDPKVLNSIPKGQTDNMLLSEDLKGYARFDIGPRAGGKPWTDPGDPIPFNPE